MFRTNWKMAWRNIRRNGMYSCLNILGLALGLTATFLIGAYAWSELSVNRSLRKADQQYILTSKWKDPNMGLPFTTAAPLAERLAIDYPHLVANYYRWDGITSVIAHGEKAFRGQIQLGDSTLLSMYGFPLLHGNAATALQEPFSVVITREEATRFFGRTDVIGEMLTIQNFNGEKHAFSVTGVLRDNPANSVTTLNSENHNSFFVPISTGAYFGRTPFDSWANVYTPSYIELQPTASLPALNRAIPELLQKHTPAAIRDNLVVEPVALNSYYLSKDNGLVQRMLLTLGLLAVFILLMAAVNFVNIAIGTAGTRSREIGVRKVLGTLRSQLIRQFLSEALLLTTLATLLSVAVYPLLRIPFGELVGRPLPTLAQLPLWSWFVPVGITVLVGLLAGSYPAFVLSAMRTVESLKGKTATVQGHVVLRKALVGFQFCIALLVLAATAVISGQVKHFFSTALGYDKTFIVAAQVPRNWSPQGVQTMRTIRNEFATVPGVSNVTLSYEIPNGMNGAQPTVYPQGKTEKEGIAMQSLVTDEHYLATYQIGMLAGNFFSGSIRDSGRVVLNEAAVKALGYQEPQKVIGARLNLAGDSTQFTVAGVVRDFHFGSMQQAVQPQIFLSVAFAFNYRYLSFKLRAGHVAEDIASLQTAWRRLLPGSPFEYNFMDDTLRKLYGAELRLEKAAYTATVLSFMILFLGVFGLVSLSVHKRMKEIGIRKTLGASMPAISFLFIKEFLQVMVIAALVAVPFTWMLMDKWLQQYADRIGLGPLPFVLAVVVLGAVTMAVICLQTIKAAGTSPVRILRTE